MAEIVKGLDVEYNPLGKGVFRESVTFNVSCESVRSWYGQVVEKYEDGLISTHVMVKATGILNRCISSGQDINETYYFGFAKKTRKGYKRV